MELFLKPVGHKPSLIRKGSFLVHMGEVPTGYDILRAVDEHRDERKHHGYIGADGLTEVYSVLTRTPFKPPLYPSEAWQVSRTWPSLKWNS